MSSLMRSVIGMYCFSWTLVISLTATVPSFVPFPPWKLKTIFKKHMRINY